MERNTIKIVQGNGNTLYKTTLKTDKCERYSNISYLLRKELLQTIGQSPELLDCMEFPFDSLTIKHNGDRWVLEATFLKTK